MVLAFTDEVVARMESSLGKETQGFTNTELAIKRRERRLGELPGEAYETTRSLISIELDLLRRRSAQLH